MTEPASPGSSPTVSVLLPVRNGMPHLEAAAESISVQTFADFEVLAVDDGSEDATQEQLRSWARLDPRVRVLGGQRVGLVGALELARKAARGRYLARMDADDVAHPERFGEQVRWMADHPMAALCGTWVRYFPDDVVRDGARRYQDWLNGLRSHEDLVRDLFVECPLAHPTFLMRAKALVDVGGYRDRGWPEDYDLVLRLWRAGHRLGVVPRELLRWREGPARHSRTSSSYSAAAFRTCKIHFLGSSYLARSRPLVIWGAGPTGKAFARALLAAGHPVSAWVDLDPRKMGQTIHGAPVFAPEEAPLATPSLVLSAVASHAGRTQVRNALSNMGLADRHDVVAVA